MCMVSLVHKAWFDDEIFVQPLAIYRRVLKKCHLSSGTSYPALPASQVYDRYSCASLLLGSFAQACMHKISSLPTDLPPTSFRRSNLFDSHWSRRSHDISQSGPHKRHLFRRITNVYQSAGHSLPLTKGLGLPSCFTPIVFPFYFLSKRKLSSSLRGPTILWNLMFVSHQRRDHCIAGDFTSLVETSCQRHLPLSSICGPLKGLSPYLLTHDPRISCVTTCHLLSL
jgi:hypothetical protein